MNNYEKSIVINSSLGVDDYRRILATIHKATHEQGYSNIALDFSDCTSAYPCGMLPLISYVRALTKSHIDFSLLLPKDDTLARRFRTSNWAHLLEPRNHDEYQPHQNQSTVPALVFFTDQDQQSCVNRIVDSILRTVSGLNRADFAAVEWALNEITDNVLNHSQSNTGGIVQLTAHRHRRRAIEFTVCDAGLGVAKTLRDARSEIKSDMDALTEAVKEGVTRNSTTNQGNGLFGSFEICRISRGIFRLHSNNARLDLSNGSVSYKSEKVPFSGTMVDATIDIADTGLLEQALKFRGKVHRPTDLIEYKYETDNLSHINFVISDEASSFASRASGKPIRIKLKNICEMCVGQKIILDFSGVSVISSSFADEVFGMLFVELGPMRFMTALAFHNASPTVVGLIDRAIALRAQQKG
ncbi:STAS-like domain-containing protein [Rugamonas sp. A1-17]|nr:STAS-like domain-containing protein [Rugamonas sp. A1-17]